MHGLKWQKSQNVGTKSAFTPRINDIVKGDKV